MQRFIGVSLGALITFVLLLFWNTTNIPSDSTTAFAFASIVGAAASFFWPIVIAFWFARRRKAHRDAQIDEEVQRQLAEQQKGGGS